MKKMLYVNSNITVRLLCLASRLSRFPSVGVTFLLHRFRMGHFSAAVIARFPPGYHPGPVPQAVSRGFSVLSGEFLKLLPLGQRFFPRLHMSLFSSADRRNRSCRRM